MLLTKDRRTHTRRRLRLLDATGDLGEIKQIDQRVGTFRFGDSAWIATVQFSEMDEKNGIDRSVKYRYRCRVEVGSMEACCRVCRLYLGMVKG